LAVPAICCCVDFGDKRWKDIWDIVTGRKVLIEIFGTKLSIGDAIEEVQEDTEDALGKLSARIDTLELRQRPSRTSNGDAENQDSATSVLEKSSRDEIFKRMIAALKESKFKWRSVERIAISVGVSESEARQILAAHDRQEIVLSKGKSGKVIVRLRDL
jgi:hypothetical protein